MALSTSRIEAVAPAKINLFLHVGPVRPDGLHELFSLFVFADGGDRLTAALAPRLSLDVEGPFAAALAGSPQEENLVWRAGNALGALCGGDARKGAAIVLEKNLPVAAGVGGGSADAAAALRLLTDLWDAPASEEALRDLAFSLGADVPACLSAAPVYVAGAGEKVMPGPSLPPLWTALVNPGVATPTGPVFQAFDRAHPDPETPTMPAAPFAFSDVGAVRSFLQTTRNDLEPHAIAAAPVIADVLGFLCETNDVICARMSGSGATCFGLYPTASDAQNAASAARDKGWWSMSAEILRGRT